jgi:hypothetical protein
VVEVPKSTRDWIPDRLEVEEQDRILAEFAKAGKVSGVAAIERKEPELIL